MASAKLEPSEPFASSSTPARPRLAILALSSGGDRHMAMRCFMRESIKSLLAPGADRPDRRRGAWTGVAGGGSLLLRFLVPSISQLESEHLIHADLIAPASNRGDDGPATCAARALDGLRAMVKDDATPDFFMLTDDDVYINSPRLLRDLYHLLDQPHHVIYGPLAFAGGWDAQKPAVHVGHYGWSPHSSIKRGCRDCYTTTGR